jgi:CRP-like cAMP-binding protein
MPSEVVAVLEKVPLFAGLSAADLRVVAERATLRDVDAGETLIAEGGDGDEFFVLLSGTADVRRGDTVVATLGAGEHFGELALLDPAPRAAAVVVTSPGRVAVLERHRFAVLLDAVPDLARAMLTGLARAVRVQAERVRW